MVRPQQHVGDMPPVSHSKAFDTSRHFPLQLVELMAWSRVWVRYGVSLLPGDTRARVRGLEVSVKVVSSRLGTRG